MYRIAIIYPYYGNYPSYFDLWLKSAAANPTVDFFIVTDIEEKISAAKNIHFIEQSLDGLRTRLERLSSSPVCLEQPYKLCDFRPAYGLLFEQELAEYDFWGYGDLDLIFGDIRSFLTDGILSRFDKLYSHGHLTLFRNNDEMRKLYRGEHCFAAYTEKEAFASPYACHFDEWRGISVIAQRKGIACYDRTDYADIERREFQFRLAAGDKRRLPQIFEWQSGRLWRLYSDKGRLVREECLYVHLQKRTMQKQRGIGSHFYIVPNRFIVAFHLTEEQFLTLAKKGWWYTKKFCIYADFVKTLLRGEWRNRLLLWKKAWKRRVGR